MIAVLLATGILGAETGVELPTPEMRVIEIQRVGSIATAQQPIDPTDVLDFVLDLSGLLDGGEQFTSVVCQVTPTSQLLGFLILEDEPFEPVALSNDRIRVWVTIDLDKRGLSQWARGTPCAIELTAVTNNTPARTWQRLAQISVGNR